MLRPCINSAGNTVENMIVMKEDARRMWGRKRKDS
jgi:hypothetical protein